VADRLSDSSNISLSNFAKTNVNVSKIVGYITEVTIGKLVSVVEVKVKLISMYAKVKVESRIDDNTVYTSLNRKSILIIIS